MTVIPWSSMDREPVEEGSYLIKVIDYKQGISLNKNPKIDWELKIVGGEGNPHIGRKIFDTHTLIEKALWRLGLFVGALKIAIKNLPDMNTGTEKFLKVLETCKGRTMWVSVIIDSYDGKPRNKITDYVPDEDQEETGSIDLDDLPEFLKAKLNKDNKVPF